MKALCFLLAAHCLPFPCFSLYLAHVFLSGFLIYFSYGIWHSFQPSYHDNMSIGDLHSKNSAANDELFSDSDQEVAVLLDDTDAETEQ